jgi:hypothetical protein
LLLSFVCGGLEQALHIEGFFTFPSGWNLVFEDPARFAC